MAQKLENAGAELLADPKTNLTRQMIEAVRNEPKLQSYLTARQAERNTRFFEMRIARGGVHGDELTPADLLWVEQEVDRFLPASPDLKRVEKAWQVGEYDPKMRKGSRWYHVLESPKHSTGINAGVTGALAGVREGGLSAIFGPISAVNKIASGPVDAIYHAFGQDGPSDVLDRNLSRLYSKLAPQEFVETQDPNRGIGRTWREPPAFTSAYNLSKLGGAAYMNIVGMLGVARGVNVMVNGSKAGISMLSRSGRAASMGALSTAAGWGMQQEVEKHADAEGWSLETKRALGDAVFWAGTALAFATERFGPEFHWMQGKKFGETWFRGSLVAGVQEFVEGGLESVGQETLYAATGINGILEWAGDPFQSAVKVSDKSGPYWEALKRIWVGALTEGVVAGVTMAPISRMQLRQEARALADRSRQFWEPNGKHIFIYDGKLLTNNHELASDLGHQMDILMQLKAVENQIPKELQWMRSVVLEGRRGIEKPVDALYASVDDVQAWASGLEPLLSRERWDKEFGDESPTSEKLLSFLTANAERDALFWTGLGRKIRNAPEGKRWSWLEIAVEHDKHTIRLSPRLEGRSAATPDHWKEFLRRGDELAERKGELAELLHKQMKAGKSEQELDPVINELDQLETQRSALIREWEESARLGSGNTYGEYLKQYRIAIPLTPDVVELLKQAQLSEEDEQAVQRAADGSPEMLITSMTMTERQMVLPDGTTAPVLTLMALSRTLEETFRKPLGKLKTEQDRLEDLALRLEGAILEERVKLLQLYDAYGLETQPVGGKAQDSQELWTGDPDNTIFLEQMKNEMARRFGKESLEYREFSRIRDRQLQLRTALQGARNQAKEKKDEVAERENIPDRVPFMEEHGGVARFREHVIQILLREAALQNYRYVAVNSVDATVGLDFIPARSVAETKALNDIVDANARLEAEILFSGAEVDTESGGTMQLSMYPRHEVLRDAGFTAEEIALIEQNRGQWTQLRKRRDKISTNWQKNLLALRRVLARWQPGLEGLRAEQLEDPVAIKRELTLETVAWQPTDMGMNLVESDTGEVLYRYTGPIGDLAETNALRRRIIDEINRERMAKEELPTYTAQVFMLTEDLRSDLLTKPMRLFASKRRGVVRAARSDETYLDIGHRHEDEPLWMMGMDGSMYYTRGSGHVEAFRDNTFADASGRVDLEKGVVSFAFHPLRSGALYHKNALRNAKNALARLRAKYPELDIVITQPQHRAELLEGQEDVLFATVRGPRRYAGMPGEDPEFYTSVGHTGGRSQDNPDEVLWMAGPDGSVLYKRKGEGFWTHYAVFGKDFNRSIAQGRVDPRQKKVSLALNFDRVRGPFGRREILSAAKRTIESLRKKYKDYDIIVFGDQSVLDELAPEQDPLSARQNWHGVESNIAVTRFMQDGRALIENLTALPMTPTTFLHEIGHVIRRHLLSPEAEQKIMKLLKIDKWDVAGEEKFANFLTAALVSEKVVLPPGIRSEMRRIRKAMSGMWEEGLIGLRPLKMSMEMQQWIEGLWVRENGDPLQQAKKDEVDAYDAIQEIKKQIKLIEKDDKLDDLAKALRVQLLELQLPAHQKALAEAGQRKSDAILSMVLFAEKSPQEALAERAAKDERYLSAVAAGAKVKAGFWELPGVPQLWGLLVSVADRAKSPALRDLVRRTRELIDRGIALDLGVFEEDIEKYANISSGLRDWLKQPSARPAMPSVLTGIQTNFSMVMADLKVDLSGLSQSQLAELTNFKTLAKTIQQYLGAQSMRLGVWRRTRKGDWVQFLESQQPFFFRFTTAPMRQVMIEGGELWNAFADAVERLNPGVSRKVVNLWRNDQLQKNDLARSGMLELSRGIKNLPDALYKDGKLVLQVLHHDPISYIGTMLRQGSFRLRMIEALGSGSVLNVSGDPYKRYGKKRVGVSRFLEAFGFGRRRDKATLIDGLLETVASISGRPDSVERAELEALSDKELRSYASTLGTQLEWTDEEMWKLMDGLGPATARMNKVTVEKLQTKLRALGRAIGGVDTRPERDVWDLVADLKTRYKQDVEDNLLEKYREAALAQNEDMVLFDKVVTLMQGKPLHPIEATLGTRLMDVMNMVGINFMLSGSAALNLTALPIIGGFLGFAKMMRGVEQSIWNREELRRELQKFHGIRNLLRGHGEDLSYALTKLARVGREIGGDLFLHSMINDQIDLVAGSVALQWIADWKGGIKGNRNRRIAKFLGLTEDDIQQINLTGMTDEHKAQVVSKAIQRMNATNLNPLDQSLIEADPRFVLVRSLKSYAFNQGRTVLALSKGIREAITSGDPLRMTEGAIGFLMMAIGIAGAAAVWDLLNRLRNGRRLVEDQENILNRGFAAITNVGTFGPLESVVNTMRYANGAGDAGLSLLPTVSWMVDSGALLMQLAVDAGNQMSGGHPDWEKRITRDIPSRLAAARYLQARMDRMWNPSRTEYMDIRREVKAWEKKHGIGQSTARVIPGFKRDWIVEGLREALIDGDEKKLMDLRTTLFAEIRKQDRPPAEEWNRIRQNLLLARPIGMSVENMIRFKQTVSPELWNRALERERQWRRGVDSVVPPLTR